MIVSKITVRVFLFLALVVALASCEKKTAGNSNSVETQQPTDERNERPALRALLTDGALFDLRREDQQMIVILFQPECDDCQNEAREISDNLSAFEGYKLYFLSSHPVDALKKFASDYKLSDNPDIVFGQVPVDQVIQNYGQIHAPSIYIYNGRGKMIKSFNGKTDVNKIIAALET